MSSEQVEKKSTGPRRRSSNSDRKRQPTNNRKRAPRAAPAEKTEEVKEAAPKKERAPVPTLGEEFVGKTLTGVVDYTVKRGKFNFGFIAYTSGEIEESTPRVYFNPSYLNDKAVFLRKGYSVEFTAEKDEEGRLVAKDIKLTAEGIQQKAENDAAYAIKKAEREKAAAEAPVAEKSADSEAKGKGPRRTNTRRGTKVTLTVTLDGASEQKTIDFVTSYSIGKLKATAASAFETKEDLSLYLVNAENPTGLFLSKKLLSKLTDQDTIRLAKKEA